MFYICDGCGAAYSHKHGWDDPAIPDENDPEYQHLIDDDIPTEDEIDDMYEDWGARFRDTWNYDG